MERIPMRMNVINAPGVYVIQSITNGKGYVGSALNIRERKNIHFQSLNGNDHFNIHLQRHYNKYGKIDLVFGIIELCPIKIGEDKLQFKKRLLAREQYYIDTLHPEFNICKTADSVMLGRHHTKETKKKQSKSKQGHKGYWKNKKRSKETKEKTHQTIINRNKNKPPKQEGWCHIKGLPPEVSVYMPYFLDEKLPILNRLLYMRIGSNIFFD